MHVLLYGMAFKSIFINLHHNDWWIGEAKKGKARDGQLETQAITITTKNEPNEMKQNGKIKFSYKMYDNNRNT